MISAISGSNPSDFSELLHDNFFTKEKPLFFKIALLGPPSSGKTEFLKTILKKNCIKYKKPSSTTKILDGFDILLNVNDQKVIVKILDLPNSKFEVLSNDVIQLADGFVFIYDITKPEPNFNRFIDKIIATKLVPAVVLVGNKSKKDRKRVLTYEFGKKLSLRMFERAVPFFEICVCDERGVEKACIALVEEMKRVKCSL